MKKQVKHVELFPKIINRKAFYNREHPVLNPHTHAYINYWKQEKKRCIEGWWVKEAKNHWRWMYPTLYFYINHWEILIIDEVEKARYYDNPELADCEWIIFAYHTAASGFSGFTEDDNYSCNLLLKKRLMERNGELDDFGREVKLTTKEKDLLYTNPYVRKKNGAYKEYMDAFDYLKLHHEKQQGTPLYDNTPINELKLTARGNGKSYCDSAMAGHEYTFDGAKYYENPLFPNKRKTLGEIMVGAANPTKTGDFTEKLQHGLENFSGRYDDGESEYPPPFFKKGAGSFDVGESYRNYYKKQINGEWKWVGTKSVIYTTNFGVDVNAGASKRLSKQFVDEVGLIESADEMLGVSKYSKKAGGVSFGLTSLSGTGGDIEKIDAAKRMFYNPLMYDIYPIRDEWEGKGWIALFLPAYYSDRTNKDENGNTIFEDAIQPLLEERDKLSRSADPLPLIQEKMFNPLVPSEMFYSTADNILPAGLATERINELEENQMWDRKVSVGSLEWGNSHRTAVKWHEKPSERKLVISDMLLDKYADKTGRIAIYEHPADIIEDRLYKVVYDPYKIDNKGESYASILVYKGIPKGKDQGEMQDVIVGEYLGRPGIVDNAHEIAIKIAMYFKTKVLFERNVPGFKKYCITNKFVHIMQPEPYEAIHDGVPGKKRTNEFGVVMTGPLKQHALQSLRTWFLEPVDFDIEGNITRYRIGKQYSLRLLNEVVNFGDGNFDHISSILLLMLWIDQDGKVPLQERVQERVDEFDEFFKQRTNSMYNPFLEYEHA